MCGILGYKLDSAIKAPDKKAIKCAIETIHHRGPDNTGFWFSEDGKSCLAHKRLSIIDISDDANQPLLNPQSSIAIIFNGEIYNYQKLKQELINNNYTFNTNSDTEVILVGYEAWGQNLFTKLEGMFAIAIFDLNKSKLLLARDRAGEKPLFYSNINGSIFFSSEIKALLSLDLIKKDINFESLNHLFSRGYSSNTDTIFADISKLDAGYFLEYDFNSGVCNINHFWSLREKSPLIYRKPSQHQKERILLNKLENLLEDSVDRQLNADVPIGMLLSGGVDSSLLVALASRSHENLLTFNVKFTGHVQHDESFYARQIAGHFKCNHNEIEASDIEPEIFEELSYFYDEPIFDTSMMPTYLLAKSVSSYCKVAIGGDGGDELFGGYPHYNKLLDIHRKTRYIPNFLLKSTSEIIQFILPIGLRGKKTLSFYGTDLSKGYPNISEFFSFAERKKIFNTKNISIQKVSNFSNYHPLELSDLIDRATFFDFKNYLKEDLLVKIDRASMANSLEIRSPFLDSTLIEFAFNEIPSFLKVSNGERKILLKRLAEKILPNNFDIQRKQGFSMPLKHLFAEKKWRDFFYYKIEKADPYIFNKKNIYKLIKSLGPSYNNEERVAGIIFFMCWLEKFKPNF